MARRAKGPDEPDAAFEAMFRREIGSIGRTAYLIVGDWEVAREVAQDAFVEVLKHWEKVRELESPGGWVRRVAIRKAVRTRRRATRGRALLGTIAAGFVGEPDGATFDVHQALLTLPPRQRAALALYYLEDRSVGEIAALMGCGDVTVRTHLARGRRAMAERLGEEFADDPR
jgi:DNA-directed RNA polymerase specialized sigma24 family protein